MLTFSLSNMVSKSANEGLAPSLREVLLCGGTKRTEISAGGQPSNAACKIITYTYAGFERSVVHALRGGRSNDDASHSKRENAGDELHV
jgi:hypothetical protein